MRKGCLAEALGGDLGYSCLPESAGGDGDCRMEAEVRGGSLDCMWRQLLQVAGRGFDRGFGLQLFARI